MHPHHTNDSNILQAAVGSVLEYDALIAHVLGFASSSSLTEMVRMSLVSVLVLQTSSATVYDGGC